MNGRFEHKIDIEERIEKRIEDSPKWLKEYYYSMANNTAATKRKYISDMLMFLECIANNEELSSIDLNSITSGTINQYFTERKKQVVNGKPISESTIATQISELKNFFDFLQKSEYIRENPMDNAVGRPSVPMKTEVSYLTREELSVIMKNLKNGVGSHRARSRQGKYRSRDKLLFLLPLSIGCRVSALDEINISDIDFENKRIKIIDKGNKYSEQYVPQEIIDLIKQWCEERNQIPGADKLDALFISKKKEGCTRLSVSAVQSIIAKFSYGLDRTISPHELRRTFGTTVYRKTGDILLTSQLLGHSSPTVTRRYASVDKDKAERVKDGIIKNIL